MAILRAAVVASTSHRALNLGSCCAPSASRLVATEERIARSERTWSAKSSRNASAGTAPSCDNASVTTSESGVPA